MDIIVVSLFFVLLLVGILAVTFGGSQAPVKGSTEPTIVCPPGFSPSQAFKEKYGDSGIAYDDKQKAIYLVQGNSQLNRTFWCQDILASALFEDESLVAISVRTDEQGKECLMHMLSEEIKDLFQDTTEQPEGEHQPSTGRTSKSIDLRILINNPEQPVYQIHFLNMEAKKGGVIHRDAIGQGKNWQDLLSYLIRLAGKPQVLQNQHNNPPTKQPSPHSQAEPVGTEQV